MADLDLFGDLIDEFKSAKARYGVWPTTVWECDMSDRTTQRLKTLVGDVCTARAGAGALGYQSKQARAGCFTAAADDHSVYRGKITESVFNPAVAAWLLNCYAPEAGLCFDPFAGGGTRAIMAAKHGLAYLGVELRQAEVDAVRERCERCGVADSVHIVCGDARDCTEIASPASADFLLTCPPYWNLEQYAGGAADLSMIEDYGEFCVELSKVVAETHRILKPGAYACWVVGLHRDSGGHLKALHHDLARMHGDWGFRFKEEIILHQKNNGAIQRVGQFDKGDRRLVRTHEYALVFVRE